MKVLRRSHILVKSYKVIILVNFDEENIFADKAENLCGL